MRISVVGLGKLGSSLAAVLSQYHEIFGIDHSKDIVAKINGGEAPVPEPGLQELIDEFGFAASTTYDAVAVTDATLVIVPTPSKSDGSFNNEILLGSLRSIGEALKDKEDYHLVVVASTVMPGSSVGSLIPVLEDASGKQVGIDIGFCYSPEFIALGSVVEDLTDPDMVLIGQSDVMAGNRFKDIMMTVVPKWVPVHVLTLTEAEIAKIAVNSYVTMKISFANTLAEICEGYVGTDAQNVTKAIGDDVRIGRYYLQPATAYGGPCFPRDQRAFNQAAQRVGVHAPLSLAADEVNGHQIQRLAELVSDGASYGSKVTVLGLVYKMGTPVWEESAGVLLLRELERRGFDAVGYDPTLHSRPITDYLEDSEVAVITTPDPMFSYLTDFNGSIIDCWGVCHNPQVYRIGVGK